MPAEWAPHECCVMAWPARRSLWGAYWDEARADVAAVARAIAAFEPVLMVCAPGARGDVAAHCGSAVDVAEIPIDDSWTRDTGPIVVTDGAGRRAMVAFGFNGWGGKYVPHDRDAALPEALADLLGFPLVRAPLVAEGGALLVDGEGTLVTTVGSVLNANRNPGVSEQDAEAVFRDYLGVERTIWLVAFPDRDTDGHIDGIAQYVAPGRLALQVPDDASGDVGAYARENLARLAAKPDAGGRAIEVLPLETVGAALLDGEEFEIPYLNCYLANGAVIVPVGDPASDEAALARMREIFPERAVVEVPGTILSLGGGGPHCITQQIPRATG